MRTNTQVLSSENLDYYRASASETPVKHPILKAFEKTEYGQLMIKSPEGHIYNFVGEKIGPVAHIYLNNWKTFDAFIARGETGFAESYMDGLWESPDLPALIIFGLANAEVLESYFYGKPLFALFTRLSSFFASNSIRGSKRNIAAHYDLGNDFYKLWLDKGMTYSCALFGSEPDISLEEAQQAKYRRILDKLGAKPGEHILEVGCGWGGFAEAAARKGIKVTGITISTEQKEYAIRRLLDAGLSDLASIQLIDYREIKEQFDYVVSIGMFEHVGENYWPTYFNTIKSCLKPGGRAMIQSITIDDDVFERARGKYGFIEQYIFPGGMLPSKRVFREELRKAGLICNEIFPFGQDYVLTLSKWFSKFTAHENDVRSLGYDEYFIRMWRMYLACSIAAFATGRTDVMQAELLNPTL